LSSSAALELASAWAMSGPGEPAASPLEVARLAQRAENEYVGVRCGLMDQFASACGVAGAAVLLDCATLDHRVVPLAESVMLVVAHTGVPRNLGRSAYNERRADCERAVAEIAERQPGIQSLRDVDEPMLERYRDVLDEVAAARASHIVRENARVLATEQALRSGDLDALGRLFADSHASLRDLYDVSSPELDAMVQIATATPGVVASRMTGAGFGGCTISLVRPNAVAALRRRIERDYASLTGRHPTVWEVDAAAGAGLLSPSSSPA
jgi:galactokinase